MFAAAHTTRNQQPVSLPLFRRTLRPPAAFSSSSSSSSSRLRFPFLLLLDFFFFLRFSFSSSPSTSPRFLCFVSSFLLLLPMFSLGVLGVVRGMQ